MIDAACAELLTAEALAISFDQALELVDPVISEVAAAGIPVAAAARSAGGVACEWSNGVPYSSSGEDGYVGIRVVALPDARVEWDAYGIATGNLEEVADVCARRVDPIVCTSSAMTLGTWSQATVIGGTAVEASLAVTNSVANQIGSGAAAGSPWLRPANRIEGCGGPLNVAALEAGLGASVDVGPIDPGTSFADFIAARAGVVGCGILVGDEFLAAIHVLPGGAWAWDDSALETSGDPVEVPGAVTTVISCPITGSCRLDAVIGDDWVRIATVDGLLPAAEVSQRLAAIIASAPSPSAG
jgi:hypothetical protein